MSLTIIVRRVGFQWPTLNDCKRSALCLGVSLVRWGCVACCVRVPRFSPGRGAGTVLVLACGLNHP